MCGRYASFIPADRLHRLFRTVNPMPNLQPTWNMAPTRMRRWCACIRRRASAIWTCCAGDWCRIGRRTRGDAAADQRPVRDVGLLADVPRCARPPALPGARRRVLRVADDRGQANRPVKLPWAIARADGAPLVFAGLWEGWRGADGTVLRTFTIVTTEANDALRPLHERMPVVLEEATWPLWLGETEGEASDLLRPSAAEFRLWRVGTEVNNVRNDRAELLAPLAA